MPQPTPPPAAPAPVPAAPLTEAEDKQWASFAHFGGILWILPSLIIFLVFRDRGAKTKVESKEALNWQITWIAAWIVVLIIVQIIGAILINTATFDTIGPISIVITLLGLIPGILYILNLIFSIMGGVKVNGGGSYRYPFAIRLIK